MKRLLFMILATMAFAATIRGEIYEHFTCIGADTVGVCGDYLGYVTPPADTVYEWWEMHYGYFADYRSGGMNKNTDPRMKLVLVAYDGKDFFIKGVFTRYPDLWIRMICQEDGNYCIPFNSQLGYDREWNRKIEFNTFLLETRTGKIDTPFSDVEVLDNVYLPTENPSRFRYYRGKKEISSYLPGTEHPDRFGFDYGANRITYAYSQKHPYPSWVNCWPECSQVDIYRNVSFKYLRDADISEARCNGSCMGDLDGNHLEPVQDPCPDESQTMNLSSRITATPVGISKSYEPVETPNVVLEDWEMIYDEYFMNFEYPFYYSDYYDMLYGVRYHDPRYSNCRDKIRKVVGGRNRTGFYFQGVFTRYPEAWIRLKRSTSDPNTYYIDDDYVICTDYFRDYQWVEGLHDVSVDFFSVGYELLKWSKTGYDVRLKFMDVTYYQNGPYMFTYDGEKKTLSATGFSDIGITHSYTYGNSVMERNVVYGSSFYDRREDFPDYPSEMLDKYMNVRFRRLGPLGMDEIYREPGKPHDGVIYNLNGLPVPEERLTPGIYIRDGRKFLVK